MYIYIHTSIHVYVYIHTHILIYFHIYICTHIQVGLVIGPKGGTVRELEKKSFCRIQVVPDSKFLGHPGQPRPIELVFVCVYVVSLSRVCDMTNSYVLRDSTFLGLPGQPLYMYI